MDLVRPIALIPTWLHRSLLPTCQISDALIKLKVSHGGHIPDISLFPCHPLMLESVDQPTLFDW
jgi:hypothetical protein